MSKDFVPDWARDAVWYQVFPERFRNGAPHSDPRAEDIADRAPDGWSVSRWGQDWYALEGWQTKRHGFWDAVFHRRFGGDLVGLKDKLDYLQDLGVTALYLNPVFQAQSLHKYDGSCFHHIDPTFGPDRDGDLKLLAEANETEDPATWVWTAADRFFLELVADVHRRGMRIIIDGVFNHAGRDFFAFRDLLRHGRASRYADWFLIKQWISDTAFEYDGWFGHKALPEFNRTQDNLAAPVKQYIFDCTSRWMNPDGDENPARGIDGWRLDVAFCVPHGFWRDWRRHVKALNPEAYLTAEIVDLAAAYLKGDEFDAVMNYMWLYPTVSFFSDGQPAMTAKAFRAALDALREAYPPGVTEVVQNLLDSHDVGRVVSVLNNPSMLPVKDFDHYFNASRVKHGGDFVTTKPPPRAYAHLRQAAVFQMTYPGAPMIYYGTEAGMWGANDPDDRQPMLWPDIDYDDETHGPHGPVDRSPRAPDTELFAFYRQAIALRRAHPCLRRGTLDWLDIPGERMIAYERRLGDEVIRVYLNAGDQRAAVAVPEGARDLWHGRDTQAEEHVEPRGWLVVERKG